MELVRQSDIARMLGISRQAVSKIVRRSEINGFPSPVRPHLWKAEDVRSWSEKRHAR